MKEYTGTKTIKAKPMTRGEYNKYRGWEIPADENPADEGYLVEYLDSPNSNHPDHDNYISWSPKDVFDRSYKETDGHAPVTLELKEDFEILTEGCRYSLPVYEVVDEIGIQRTRGQKVLITFVRGSKLADEEVEKQAGTLHEHLLSVMIHDLKFKNGLVPSREGGLIITKLEEALHWIRQRQIDRQKRNVVGTYQK